QEKEAASAWGGFVTLVQSGDRLGGTIEQPGILLRELLISISPVRKKSEDEVAADAGKVMNLKSFHLLQKVGYAGKKRRHRDEGPHGLRDAMLEREAGQNRRAETPGHRAVD